jgi:hypothetical protein
MPEHKGMIPGAKLKNAANAMDCAFENLGVPKVGVDHFACKFVTHADHVAPGLHEPCC